jgi:hypothetical protein
MPDAGKSEVRDSRLEKEKRDRERVGVRGKGGSWILDAGYWIKAKPI